MPNKRNSRRVSIGVQLALLLVCSIAAGSAFAQEDLQATNIVRPQPDSNGVDLVSGGMYIPELNFAAPGASNLQLAIARSEKGNEINPLNATLSAMYLDPFGDGAPWPRMYTAVVDGLAVRFECDVDAINNLYCWEASLPRGATLEHVNGSVANGYIFTAPDGTRAQFPPFPEPDLSTPLEAPEVVYPSGEKISYQHTSAGGVSTRLWTSNLGYSVSSAWTGGTSETRRLYKGGSLLNTITTIREDVSGSGWCTSYTRKATDDLGRIMRIRYVPATGPEWNQFANAIAWYEDATGLRTTINYHGQSSCGAPYSGSYGSWLVSTLVRNGKTWSYSDDYGSGPPKIITDPLGAVREVVSEPSWAPYVYFGNVVSSKTPLGRTSTYEYFNNLTGYHAIDHLATVTFPEGNKFKYVYDDRGNVTLTTEIPKTGGAGHPVYQAGYPATCSNRKTCNKPQWTRDAAGSQTDYTYDSTHGGLLTRLEPVDVNGKRRKIWNEYVANNTGNGLVYRVSATHLCSILASGAIHDCQTVADRVTRFTYWGNTFLPQTETRTNGIDSVSATTTYSYDSWGRALSVADPTNVTKYFRYDVMGRKTWEVSSNGAGSWIANKITYDNGDRIIRVDRGTLSDPNSTAILVKGSTINAYDVEGRQIKSEFVDADYGRLSVQQFSYDAIARPICTVQRMNPAAFDVTADACAVGPAASYGPDRVTKNTYDLDGRVSKTVQGFGAMNGGLGIVAEEIDYSTNGQVKWRRDGKGNQTDYFYDEYDRLYRSRFPDWSIEQSEYDLANRLWKFTKRNGQLLTHGYDGASRLTSTSFSNGEPTITRNYDGQGRPDWVSRAGQTVDYVWEDPLGRLSSEIQPSVGAVSYAYDLAGRQSRITWPGSYWVDYDYNSAGSLWRVRELGAASGLGEIARWTFDGLGRRATIARGNGTTTALGRDAADRLLSLSHDAQGTSLDVQYAFARNPASQIASRTFTNSAWVWSPPSSTNVGYTPDALNRYASVGGATLSYDGNGNLTFDGSRTYGYDLSNYLTSVSGGGAPAAALAYDPQGRLHAVSASGLTTRFLYDGSRVIAAFDGNGNLMQRYVPGVGTNMPLLSLEGSATAANAGSAPNSAKWLMADERGSVIGLTNASGSPSINTYGPYGEPSSSNQGRFGYTGQLWIPEIGLYHYRARAYNPVLGRFMQTDPIGYKDGLNLYAYVRNDPLNFTDPTGTENQGLPFNPDHEKRAQDDPKPKDPPKDPTLEPKKTQEQIEQLWKEALAAAELKQKFLEEAAEARANEDWEKYNTANRMAAREEANYQRALNESSKGMILYEDDKEPPNTDPLPGANGESLPDFLKGPPVNVPPPGSF